MIRFLSMISALATPQVRRSYVSKSTISWNANSRIWLRFAVSSCLRMSLKKRHVGCSWMRALVMKMESHRICISWRKLCLQMAGAHINSAGLTQNGIALTVQKNKSHSCISVCWRPWGHLCQGLVSAVTRRAHRDIRYSKEKKRTNDLHACLHEFP